MNELDVLLLAVAIGCAIGCAIVAVDAWMRARRARRADERRAARAWYPAAVGPTERLVCCDAPDVPDGADYCIACGRQVRP